MVLKQSDVCLLRVSEAFLSFREVDQMGYRLSALSLLYFVLCASPWFVTASSGNCLCSTSLPGGKQVEGLPPAPSAEMSECAQMQVSDYVNV